LKKVICKKEYNTDTAKCIYKYTYSYFGDEAGYEEILFQTPEGLYFLYVNGGKASPYPKENIQRIAKAKIDAWLETH